MGVRFSLDSNNGSVVTRRDGQSSSINPSCDVLNGDKALQCFTAKVIGEIKSTSSLVAKRILEEGKIVSAKIKKTSVNNANTIQKYDFSFARSFLQVYDKLDLLVSTCSKLVGIKKLRCLINLGTNSVNITTSTAAKDVLRIAGNTADQVTTLTRVVNTISGFEDLSKQIKKSTNDMMKKAKDISGKIKTAGKSTINDINKAGGIQKAFLEGMKVNLNVNPCPGLSGVTYMNCISKNAAKKMKFIGTKVARDFLSKTNNMANKISSLGNDVAMHVEKEFLKLNSKSGVMNKDAFSSPVPSYLKSLIACQSLVGFPKIKCIIVRGAGQIHTSGKSNSNAVKKVGLVASSKVLNVANNMQKISGFEKITKRARSAAGAMRTKSKSLAETVLKSCRTAEVDILLISGIKSPN